MNRVSFGEGACERTRKYLDSYVNSELQVETNHEVLRHLEGCPNCSAELDTLMKLRGRLKSAVKSQDAPAELEFRIRTKIRTRRGELFEPRWAMAAAAGLLVAVGTWSVYSREGMPAIGDRPAQTAYIQKISNSLASVMKLGLGDHVHCAVFRKYPKNPPPVEQMMKDLGPSFEGLLPVVRAAVPQDFRVVMAHECSFAGRNYVHFTFKREAKLLSLVVTRKTEGESMTGLTHGTRPDGVPIYQQTAGQYQVAGFEAGEFLAYIISDLPSNSNLQVASNLAPSVREFLIKTNG
jgi:anti-sigma factor (TIGR02949 family)